MTMIDGKATSILCDTSSQRCNICKATPTEMNNLPLIMSKQSDPDLCKYGLSSLHIWIRMMECILHIAYRLTIKTWTVKGDNKCIMENRKKNNKTRLKIAWDLWLTLSNKVMAPPMTETPLEDFLQVQTWLLR